MVLEAEVPRCQVKCNTCLRDDARFMGYQALASSCRSSVALSGGIPKTHVIWGAAVRATAIAREPPVSCLDYKARLDKA